MDGCRLSELLYLEINKNNSANVAEEDPCIEAGFGLFELEENSHTIIPPSKGEKEKNIEKKKNKKRENKKEVFEKQGD